MVERYQQLRNDLTDKFPQVKSLSTEEAQLKYGDNTIGQHRLILGAIYPVTQEQVAYIVLRANVYKISLYAVSTGHNWGYGSATPVLDDCVIVNLSDMNKIVHFDNDNGLVTVEPGVTLHQLWTYLNENNYQWIVPTTGAGYMGSLIGNALERGFGVAPTSDHYASMMNLKAILGDGSLYESLHESLTPSTRLGDLYKWGLGAYCDGLFSQSNLGIVTQMTLALRKQPEELCVCFLGIQEECMGEAISFIKTLYQSFMGNLGNVQLLNKTRLLGKTATDMKPKVSDWTIFIALYGAKKLVHFIKKDIKIKSRQFAERKIFIWESNLNLLDKLPRPILNGLESLLKVSFTDLKELFAFYRGKPSNLAVRSLIYHDVKEDLSKKYLDLEEDKKGIIWFAPLIPHQVKDLRAFIELIQGVLTKYDVPISLTLTSFSGYCFDATLPLIFNIEDSQQVSLMHACYEEILQLCIKHEYIPYRLGIQSMPKLMGASLHHDMVSKIKQSTDPNNILSPGRYHFSL